MKKPSEHDLSTAISDLSWVVIACNMQDRDVARARLVRSAQNLAVTLDVYAEGNGTLRVVQEHALTAAKALCEVRAPAVHGNPDHPDARERSAEDVAESLLEAHNAITSAWEILCGRRPV